MIAGKQRALLAQREAQMIGGVARRRHGLDRRAADPDEFSVRHHAIRRIIAVVRGVEAVARLVGARRVGRAADHRRAGSFPQ